MERLSSLNALRPDQIGAASRVLSEAFWDDPLLQIMAPNENKRAKVGPWFFSTALTYGMRWGEVSCNDDVSAVAVWLPPGETEMTPMRMLKVGMGSIPFKAGLGGTIRFMRALSATEKIHKALKVPHWYLLALGTSPASQGHGLGTALIGEGTAKADAAGVPCYLETATDSNIAFYSKRGFEVAGQADVLGFKLTGMVRPPR